MTITVNGTTLEAVSVIGATQFYQGTNRKTLEIHFATGETDFAELNTLFANPGSITIMDDGGTYQHDNYALRVSTALRPVVVTPETDEAPAVMEDRYVIVLAQKTYMETLMEEVKLKTDITFNGFVDFCYNLPYILGGM